MIHHEHPVCGRCGVYRHLHPTRTCATSRRSFWLDEHHVVMHVTGWAWSKVGDRARWAIIRWLGHTFPKRLHWCDLVDAAWRPESFLDDYRDDWCNLPTPLFGIRRPPTTPCYCNNIPFEQNVLPLHRTAANVGVRCGTCDGGGCPDCTDPA